ncbi:hypothetical protein FQR65_LT20738 [Abscondita terminalis]|nr:hypothetical protein FQR65_LT20738 [Abscondita terminalis]
MDTSTKLGFWHSRLQFVMTGQNLTLHNNKPFHTRQQVQQVSIGLDQTKNNLKRTVDVNELVKTGDKFQRAEAKKIFCDAYDRLVTQAKDQGLKPVYITSLGTNKDQQITAIQQAELEGFLPAPVCTAQIEHIANLN